MTKRIAIVGVVTLLAFAAALPGLAAQDSPCERAAAIKKDVERHSDKMPQDVQRDLLRHAAELCPDSTRKEAGKAESSGAKSARLTQAEELLAQGKVPEALRQFERALSEVGESICPRLFEIARKLTKEDRKGLAKAFFEAGLSACDDEAAQREYDKLAAQVPEASLEAKGASDLVSKQVIVESLSSRADRRRPHRTYERYWRDRDRRDRDRWESGRCLDDEDAPKEIFPIRFHSGSAELTSEAKEQLDLLGSALRSRELRHIRRFFIDGHTDSIGSRPSNCDLAELRAESVARYLVREWDIHPRRFITRAFGENCPLVPNDDSVGRRVNRRVEIRNADMAHRNSEYAAGRCNW